jgi:hypothetical protein
VIISALVKRVTDTKAHFSSTEQRPLMKNLSTKNLLSDINLVRDNMKVMYIKKILHIRAVEIPTGLMRYKVGTNLL